MLLLFQIIKRRKVYLKAEMDQRRGSADGCGNVKRSVRGDCSTGCCERERETASEVKNEKIFAPRGEVWKTKVSFLGDAVSRRTSAAHLFL